MYEKKKSFYYIFMNETSIKSYRSIIENMNSGFISILNYKIVRVNHILYSHLMKIDKSREENKEEVNINFSNKNTLCDRLQTTPENNKNYLENLKNEESKALLNTLFNNLLFESNIPRIEGNTEYEMAKEFLKNYKYTEAIQSESFIFLGTKEFKYEGCEASYYEIFGRYSHIFKADKKEKFEFLFNDVSKTKISESINANIKYKSIFLSKIAHEFKNPLICVSELVDQVNESLEKLIPRNSPMIDNSHLQLKETLNTIKSINEYLLILVKDLDFFSLKHSPTNSAIKLEKTNVKLKRIIKYSDDITNVLLKKYQKESRIKFTTNCSSDLSNREIFTDELRIKQLLINILSNSVKYTYSGFITLQVLEENEKIMFKVIDTGKGLTEEQKQILNSNKEARLEIGNYSSGLGFSIIREIIGLLGSSLIYETAEYNGSMFSFSIDNSNLRKENFLDYISIGSNSSIDSVQTVVKAFSANNEAEIVRRLSGLTQDIIMNNESITACKVEENLKPKIEFDKDSEYYVVVDDEQITRKSTIRILNRYFESKKQSIRKKIIIEATDGLECLYLFQQFIKQGIKLACIISDQTMEFMNGGICAKILNEISRTKVLKRIPFMIVTAYENLVFEKHSGVDKGFTKPISIKNIEEIDNFLSDYKY